METETRSWGFEHTFQEFGSIRVNILGIWIDSGTPAPKMKSRSKIHAKFAVFSLFFCVFHPQNPQNFRLRRPDPQKSLNPQDFFQNASKSPALRNTPPPHPPSGGLVSRISGILSPMIHRTAEVPNRECHMYICPHVSRAKRLISSSLLPRSLTCRE